MRLLHTYRVGVSILLCVLGLTGEAAAQVVRDAVVAVPAVVGPIPGAPFLASSRNLEPLDLARLGYVEEEFILRGTANVYDWAADGTLSVRTPNAPYATRILVRRPSRASRFSGNVVVEMMYGARRFDWPMMWGYSREFFLENGDAWIGITMPNAVEGLKRFNPERYAAVSFANPSKAPCTPTGTLSPTEEGLRWDVVAQVAALLRSEVPGRPLSALKVEATYLTMQGGDLLTFIGAIHPAVKLSNGKPVYDGYLSKSPTPPVRIHQCATAPPAGDPRRQIRKTNVPVIAVVAQGEVLDAIALRRPESDEPGDKLRYYEIAGGGHIDKYAYTGFPPLEDQIAAVGSAQGTPEWPFTATCTPSIPLMASPLMADAFNSAFLGLELWVRKGIPAPRSRFIDVKDAGTLQAAIMLDQHGNGVGGVRHPYVEVPTATYFTNSPGPGVCREMGREAKFDALAFNSLYPNAKVYEEPITRAAERLAKERWIIESAVGRIRQEARQVAKDRKNP